MKGKQGLWFGGIGALGIALGFGLSGLTSKADTTEKVTPLPVILTKVQSLGELHTAKYSYNNIFDYSTHRKPQQWAASVPMLGSMIQASTTNKAQMTVHGSVEAGYDLRQVSAEYVTMPSGGQALVLTIPEATIYEPQVRGEVNDHDRGLFWRDNNISVKALSNAKARFRSASLQQGIEEEAKNGLEETLGAFLAPLHSGPIEYRYTT